MLYCGAAFGGSFLFMRIAAPDLPAFVVAFGRIGLATLILLAFSAIARPGSLRPLLNDWRGFIVMGFFMIAAPFLLFAYAERFITAGLGGILNATTPLFTVIIVTIWLGQKLTLKRIAALVIGFAGVGVIVGFEGLHIAPDAYLGVIAALVAASLYGIGLTFARRRMSHIQPLPLVVGMLVAATIMLAPGAIATWSEAHPQLDSTLAVLGIATVSTAIALPILFHINRIAGPMVTSTIPFLNPIFSVLWGVLFLGETVSPTLLSGAVLVFLSLALILELPLPRLLARRPAEA
jgi:drug/metabolite transporter (DMT)-like permease